MSKESNYIPFSEIKDLDIDPLIWRVTLPEYVPAEEIGTNIRRLGRIAQLSGFESFRFASYDGDITKVTPGISSAGQDGSATATIAQAISKAETSQHSVLGQVDASLSKIVSEKHTWTKGAVLLNISEIEDRVSQKTNVRDPKAWAKELNTALAEGIRKATKENLIKRPSTYYKIADPLSNAVNLLGIDVLTVHDFSPVALLGLFTVGIPFLQLTYSPAWDEFVHKSSLKNRRWSLVPGIQFDRVVAANGLSRLSPLVKHLKRPTQ